MTISKPYTWAAAGAAALVLSCTTAHAQSGGAGAAGGVGAAGGAGAMSGVGGGAAVGGAGGTNPSVPSAGGATGIAPAGTTGTRSSARGGNMGSMSTPGSTTGGVTPTQPRVTPSNPAGDDMNQAFNGYRGGYDTQSYGSNDWFYDWYDANGSSLGGYPSNYNTQDGTFSWEEQGLFQ